MNEHGTEHGGQVAQPGSEGYGSSAVRLDQGLIGLIEIPMPRSILRRVGFSDRWVMERWDTTMRFKSVRFQDPDETLMLPVSVTSLRVTRGAGMPRLRTLTEYSGYKRFLTGGRVVPQQD